MRNNCGCRLCRIIPEAFILVALKTALLMPAIAADLPEVRIRQASGKIQVDGVLDEPSWQEPPSAIDLIQVEPRSGELPSETTKIWLAYSKD